MNRIRAAETVCGAAVILVLLVSCAGADFGVSGWEIFKKIQSSQFSGIARTAPMNADISGMLYNPAVLGTFRSREVSFISEQGMAQDKFGSVIYAEPLRRGMIAASFAYYDAGQVELNWLENGVIKTENVSAQKDMMGVISYQHRPLKSLSWGVSLKGASSELAERRTAYAYAGDMGLMLLPVQNLSISFVAQNIGVATKFIEKANPLPTAMYAGCGYVLRARSTYILTTFGMTYLINDAMSVPEAGIELGTGLLSLNAGYRNYAGESNLHVGLRIMLKDVVFGYALLPGVHLDTVHRISLGYRFKANVTQGSERRSIQEKPWYYSSGNKYAN